MTGLVPLVAAIAYAGALFGLAALVERLVARPARVTATATTTARARGDAEPGPLGRLRLPAYTLALAVYCTSWTFFGAVGSAAADGWSYLPIYLGPILLFAFGRRFLSKMIAAAAAEGATSVSDFIAARFGRSRTVAALVTLLALMGTIPYLALQLRSVSLAWSDMAGTETRVPIVLTAIGMTVFAILFGTRRYGVSGRHAGLHFAVAAESLVKLAALVAVAVFAALAFAAAPPAVRDAGRAALSARFDPAMLGIDFVVVSLLAAAAVIALPRQFHVTVTEAHGPRDIAAAAPVFIVYLLATSLVVPPIALAGLALLPGGAPPDLFVLDLPLAMGADGLALLVFIGGFSAATGMVIVETVALSTMVSNDLVGPLLLRNRRVAASPDVSGLMLLVRRIAICAVMGAGLAYAVMVPGSERLASIGLVAFAAMAQFAPALVLAVRGGGRDPVALSWGLATGLLLWLWTLFLPMLLPALDEALAGHALRPSALLGITGSSTLTHGLVASLGANLLVHSLAASRRRHLPRRLPSLLPRELLRRIRPARRMGQVVSPEDLSLLVARFAGPAAGEALARSARGLEGAAASGDPAAPVPAAPVPGEGAPLGLDRRILRDAERAIAGVIGAPSARTIMASALSGTALGLDEVVRLLDDTGQSLQFSKGLLAATLEHIDPGVSVIDRDLTLVAWNRRYLDLFDYPPGMVRVGRPIADLIRWNALRGECGPGEVEAHVARRIAHMTRAERHSFERVRPDGRVIKTVGGPMPGGGYVMCFTDITAEATARAQLIASRGELEMRVAARTRALADANRALAKATADKTRFLAAASHDLLQPLHAARLFTAALGRTSAVTGPPTGGMDPAALVTRIDQSIVGAERLLRTLLDISRLDAGGIVPDIAPVAVDALVRELAQTFEPMAADKGLALRLAVRAAGARTDAVLLRSVLQNLIGNAVRHTAAGGVLVAVRPRGPAVRIEVYDTGPGIPEEARQRIFQEFERLGSGGGGSGRGAGGGGGGGEAGAGVGLGLSIVERTARLIGAGIALDSRVGRGSRFTVILPADAPATGPARPVAVEPVIAPGAAACAPGAASPRDASAGQGLRVLVVDDDAAVREATAVLLAARGHRPVVAADGRAAPAVIARCDAAILDFDLGPGSPDGLAVAAACRAARVPALLVTGDRSARTLARAAAMGVPVQSKPLDPGQLDAWLATVAGPMAEAARPRSALSGG